MVFEHLFPEQLLENKRWTAFVLAAIYSTISIFIARLIFPANSGLVSVVFTSIFLIPYFSTILKREETQELGEQSFLRMLVDNKDALLTYLAIFLGIYCTYMLYSFLAPSLGYDTSVVFREQLSLDSLRGGANFGFSTFAEILRNNWWVLLACFLLAMIAGDGAIFFIAWNASTWGTIFGHRAIIASLVTGESGVWLLLTIIVITLPHLILEGMAYMIAAIAGGVISDEVDEPEELRFFVVAFVFGMVLFITLLFVLRMLLPGVGATLLSIPLALGILWCLQYTVESRDRQVFKYNVALFAFGILIFIIGASVETFVLYNSEALAHVYNAALGFV